MDMNDLENIENFENMEMSSHHFSKIGQVLFGERWISKLARETNLSQPLVSQIKNGKVPISPKTRESVLELLKNRNLSNIPLVNPENIVQNTQPDVEISINNIRILTGKDLEDDIAKRFSVLVNMVDRVVNNTVKSLIISGPTGVGKSYTTITAMRKKSEKDSDFKFDNLKGGCSAVGLYKTLFEYKDDGVIVIDDCDSVFNDMDTLNILKAALDSSDERVISWRKSSGWVTQQSEEEYDDQIKTLQKRIRKNDEEAQIELDNLQERIPNKFVFNGRVIFITNIDFHAQINNGTKLSNHLQALIARCFYVDLGLHNDDAKILHIKNVTRKSPKVAKELKISNHNMEMLLDYIDKNKTRWHTISLRLVEQLAELFSGGTGWEELAEITLMRN